MADPTTDNQALETFDSIASSVVLKALLPVAEKAAETAAEAEVPFLAFPVVKQIFEGVADHEMELFARELLTIMVQSGVKIIVTIQTDAEKTAYLKAEGDIKAALLTKDPAKIAEARKAFNAAADSVIHSDGWLVTHHE